MEFVQGSLLLLTTALLLIVAQRLFTRWLEQGSWLGFVLAPVAAVAACATFVHWLAFVTRP